jgi:Protein of unknown function (DUF1800)
VSHTARPPVGVRPRAVAEIRGPALKSRGAHAEQAGMEAAASSVPESPAARARARGRAPHAAAAHRHAKHPQAKRHGGQTPGIAPPPPKPSGAAVSSVSGRATRAQVTRLLWRAAFGPSPGQAAALAGRPLPLVVHSLTRPAGAAVLSGPPPTNAKGGPLDPIGAWGDDHCWWLDRMVRTNQPLVERMTFIWHDWFATSNDQVNDPQLMLNQNATLRANALGSFADLFQAVTIDPAMLVSLNGVENTATAPNENYAREMMELFSLGADRGAYTEDDVRQMARALTGWTNDWSTAGRTNFRFDAKLHDATAKTVFGKRGNWTYTDAVKLCLHHPLHPSFFVTKLWSYFIPTPPDAATLASLQGLYLSSRFAIRPVVEAILLHPAFHHGPELITPPAVYNAGLLRAVGRYVDTTDWAWLGAAAGQLLFYPPSVAGWDFGAWIDTSTLRGRWDIANYVAAKSFPDPWAKAASPYDPAETPAAALARAHAYWGRPAISEASMKHITAFATNALGAATADWQQSPYRAMRQNALRMLIATSPDMQLS